MRPWHFVAIAGASALAACAGQKKAASTAVLTAAEIRAAPPAPSSSTVLPREEPIDRKAPVERWRERYPSAARVLDEWAARYPEAAARLAAWSAEEPERLDVLVMWAVTSPHESLQTFLSSRSSWRTLSALEREHPRALAAFMHWVRQARPAAEELAVRPGGLAVVARAAGR
jgi:hypothetical protein